MTVYCNDWSCPCRVSCAHHFGRSEAYAGMDEMAVTRSFGRRDGAEACPDYRFDRPKHWLVPRPGQATHNAGW